MRAVTVGGVLALSAAAESEGLTGFRIDFVGGGLPAHGMIIQCKFEKGSVSWGRWNAGGGSWKAGGRSLVVLLIPIEEDTGRSIEGQLVGLLKAAPAILVCFVIESDICF